MGVWPDYITPGVIKWFGASKYDNGFNPSVALYRDTVVEVHEAGDTGALWYRVGKVNWGVRSSGVDLSTTEMASTLL